MLSFDVRGLNVETKIPSLSQLSQIREASESSNHAKMRDLIKGILVEPTFERLALARPGCFPGLGAEVLEAVGVGGTVNVLEPFELDDVMAEAYVAQEDRGAKLYKDPDDERRKLFPVVFELDGEEQRAILRYPSEREVDQVRRANTFEAFATFATKVCVWGDLKPLESTAPGMYLTLTLFVLDMAGSSGITRRGKFKS